MDANTLVWDDGDLEKQGEVESAFHEWHEEDQRRKEIEENSDDDFNEANGIEDEIEGELRSDTDGDEGPTRTKSRKRQSRSGSEHSSQTDQETSDSELSDAEPRQRRKTSPSSHVQPSPRRSAAEGQTAQLADPRQVELERKRRHNRNGNILSEYYDQGDYYGESIAGLIYGLATDLGREDNDLLWFAIVGLTSMAIQNRTTKANYALYYAMYKDEVVRLNPPALVLGNVVRANGSSSNDSSIKPEAEYRFMLYRHWSLYDAMLHSPYLGAKMKIYSEPGKKQLHKLFAKMGFSLTQCRQIYTHMDLDLKRNLREKLAKFAPQYGLDDLLLKSFVRAYGFKCTLSASDTSYAITALLEIGRMGPLQRAAHYKSDENDSDMTQQTMSEIRQDWLQNFNDAFDALDNIDLLQKAIPVSMELHKAIVRTGTALIDKREIRSLRSFRMTVVKEGPDISIFTHPLALSKLALWISEAINETEREKGKTKHLPFVIAALDERTDRYLVLGTSVTNNTHHISDDPTGMTNGASDDNQSPNRNKFGNAFQALSTSHQARFRLDSFDASVVECNKADLGQLLETLSLQVLV